MTTKRSLGFILLLACLFLVDFGLQACDGTGTTPTEKGRAEIAPELSQEALVVADASTDTRAPLPEPLTEPTKGKEKSKDEPQSLEQPSPQADAGPQEPLLADEPAAPEVPFTEPVFEPTIEVIPEPVIERVPEPSTPLKPLWIGVGNFGLKARTFDGVKWDKQGGTGSGNQHTPDLLRGIDYGEGVFVAVGGNNNSLILRSEDSGKTWQDVSLTSGGWLGGVTYFPDTKTWFVAKGYAGTVYFSKDKGKTWKSVDTTKSKFRRSSGVRNMSAYNGKVFAHGDSGTFYVSDDQGVTWQDRQFTGTGGISFVVFFKGSWYAGGGNTCKVSKDLKKWSNCTFPHTVKNIYSGTVTGGIFVMFHNDRYATEFTYTADGKTWKNGKTAVYTALEGGGLWLGFRYGSLYSGSSVSALKKASGGPGGFRDWVVGLGRP